MATRGTVPVRILAGELLSPVFPQRSIDPRPPGVGRASEAVRFRPSLLRRDESEGGAIAAGEPSLAQECRDLSGPDRFSRRTVQRSRPESLGPAAATERTLPD